MSSDHSNVFTKDNLDMYLKELAKEFRKINGKSVPAEIILIGGAAILVNYGFRNMTTDVDAVIRAVPISKRKSRRGKSVPTAPTEPMGKAVHTLDADGKAGCV